MQLLFDLSMHKWGEGKESKSDHRPGRLPEALRPLDRRPGPLPEVPRQPDRPPGRPPGRQSVFTRLPDPRPRPVVCFLPVPPALVCLRSVWNPSHERCGGVAGGFYHDLGLFPV